METERRVIRANRITFSSGAKVGGGIYQIGARWGHAGVSLGKRVLVFGGQGESLYSNTSVYDPITSVWSEVNTVDKGPSGRYGHTATLIEDAADASNQKVMIFGGKNGKKYLNDLFSLDLRTMSWSTFHFEKSTLPDSRAGHSCTFVPARPNGVGGNKLVVFGGSHSDKYLNSCFVLEYPRLQTGTVKWTKPPIKGKAPPQRCGHTADYLKNLNSILIFGGFDGRRSYNDMHLLNMTDMSWHLVKPNGTIPSNRNGHTSVLVGGRYLVFYGGCSESYVSNDIQVLDTNNFTWLQQPMITGTQLFPRFNHSSSILDSGEMIVFGGCASGVLYSDMCSLDLKLFLPQPQLPPPPPQPQQQQQQQQQQLITPPTTPTPIQHQQNIPSSCKEITYSTPQYSLEIQPHSHSHTTTPTPLSPSCNSCQNHNYPHQLSPNTSNTTTTTTSTIPPNSLQIQLTNALALLNSEQNQKTNLSDELMKTKNERAEAFRNAMEEQSKIENLEKELNKIENAYKKELTQKNKVQDSLFKITSTLKEKETIIQSYQEIASQLKNITTLKDDSKKDSPIVQLLYQFSSIGSNISSMPFENLQTQKENILNKTLGLQLEELKQENQKLKQQSEQDKLKSLELDLIKQSLVGKLGDCIGKVIKVDNLLGDKLDNLSMKELDKLEEIYHNGLKKVGAAKQDLLQQQLIRMQREKDENAASGNGKTCVVCVDLLINVVLVPCRHSCICSTCAKKLSLCPLCRAPIKDIFEYY